MASAAYGEHPTWTPARPRYRPTRVVLSWLVSALALLVASYLVPHVTRQRARRRDRRLRADRDPERAAPADRRGAAAALHADRRLPARARARRGDAPAHLADQRPRRSSVDSFWWALLTALIASAVTIVLEVDLRDERRRHVHVPGDPADREAGRRPGAHRRAGDPLPRDRRARAARAAAGDARRQRAGDGELGGAGHAPPRRVGDRLLVADRARARPGSCSARTTTSPRSAGSRSRRGGSTPARRRPTAPRSSAGTRTAGACCGTAARAAATCSRARPTT